MKKLLFLAAALSAACAASAQGYYTDAYNPDITRHTGASPHSARNSYCPR